MGTDKTNPLLCVEGLVPRVRELLCCQQDMCDTQNTKTQNQTNILWILHFLLQKSLKK